MKPKILLIHGNGGGTGQDNWFPSVQRELERRGHEVLAPNMPDPIEAKAAVWLPYLEEELQADAKTIIIGHSSGAVAAMRYAETHQLYGSVLVGTCYTDLGAESEKISGYYNVPWDWEAIKRNQRWIIEFASTDDPYIPISEARYVHAQLNTIYYEFTDRGHFGSDQGGMREFPELIAAVEQPLS